MSGSIAHFHLCPKERRGAPPNGSLKGGASGIGRRKRRLGDLSALIIVPFLNSFFAFSSLFLFSVSVLPFPLRFKRVLKPAGAFSVVLPSCPLCLLREPSPRAFKCPTGKVLKWGDGFVLSKAGLTHIRRSWWRGEGRRRRYQC